jgi:hypothetical protein
VTRLLIYNHTDSRHSEISSHDPNGKLCASGIVFLYLELCKSKVRPKNRLAIMRDCKRDIWRTSYLTNYFEMGMKGFKTSLKSNSVV